MESCRIGVTMRKCEPEKFQKDPGINPFLITINMDTNEKFKHSEENMVIQVIEVEKKKIMVYKY